MRTPDGLPLVFGVNYIAHFALTQLLLPALIAGSPSRVVNLSSVTHYGSSRAWSELGERPVKGAYGASKLAMTMSAYELDRRMKAAGLDVAALAVNPGGVASDIWRTLPRWQQRLMSLVLLTPPQGAATSLSAAVDDGWRGGEYLVPYVKPCGLTCFEYVGPFGGVHASRSCKSSYDTRSAAQLWQLSMDWCKRVIAEQLSAAEEEVHALRR
eukprot:PLAT7905.2.p2 GENE.PLAT7905.2~~PLAT7905.2.p2  ORF type:complete len:212 (-),score=83.46 PLAT7905.2:75-710(-)